ncbi:MAG: hypothetical protein PHE78_08690, partial [Candidatus Gastranaerophilales bacterium]|nr:hypothetical protein [Candidatus Gastranaerophilales bacterium]
MSNKLYKIQQDLKKNNQRIAWVRLIAVFVIFLILCKLFCLQIIDVDRLKKKASIMRQNRALALNQAMRGDIVDRNGQILVTSRCFYDIYIDPRELGDDIDIIETKLSQAIGLPKDVIKKKIENEKKTVILAKNVNIITYKKVKELGLKCLDIRQKPGRDYPQGKLAAHVLGYVNP